MTDSLTGGPRRNVSDAMEVRILQMLAEFIGLHAANLANYVFTLGTKLRNVSTIIWMGHLRSAKEKTE